VDLFGGGGGMTAAAPDLRLEDAPRWALTETLSNELAAAGFYLSGHPLDDYQDTLAQFNVLRWADFAARVEAQGRAEARLAATVIYRQDRKSKSGNRFAFAGFSDPSGQFEAVIFSDTLASAGDRLEAGAAVLLSVEAEAEGETIKTRVQSVAALDQALGRQAKPVRIIAHEACKLDEIVKHLPGAGASEVRLVLRLAEQRREVEFALPGRFALGAKQLSALKTVRGVIAVV
jgi:DNA polymerase-3 subunit alpha